MKNPKPTGQQWMEREIVRAVKSYKRSDEGRWATAYHAAQVVGKYGGGTNALAAMIGKSPDTVEDLAHAYWLYDEFRRDARYRYVIRAIRRAPYIHYSNFRALYEAKESYHLTLEQIYSIFVDLVHAEGGLSQRDLEVHIRERFGDQRDWTYFGAKAFKQLHELLQRPDLPRDVREALIPAHSKLGDKA